MTWTHFTCPDQGYVAVDKEGGYNYYLNVCGNLETRKCRTSSGKKESGVCQQKIPEDPSIKDKVAGLWTSSEENLR